MNKIDFRSATTLREPAELVAHGLAAAADLPDLQKVAARYAVAVTADIAALIDADDPDDPIARQFIPSADELVTQPGENADPIGDHAHSPVAGIVHRYPDRVLFKLVHVCAVYCRFCFRREMVGPGKATAFSQAAYQDAVDYIRAHPEVWEVILTDKARAACADMIDAGIPLVSQSVLLRGVNDNAAALEALMRAFVECRIKPYYLHHGDLAPGTAHLRTTLAHGQELMRALRGRVSGLCQPDYVLDIPGGHGKSPVGPNYLSQTNSLAEANSFAQTREQDAETRYRIVDYCGDVHLYPPQP